MTSPGLDTEVDRLYQLPPDQFTSARNALAKTAGADAARIRALVKPPVAAWAVNQLFWHGRDTWDALIAAAENARHTHKAVLSGRAGDVRAASKVHDDAVEAALKTTLKLLTDAGHPASDAARQAIVTTLRALPGDEPAGRLTQTLQPGGFEALAGLSIGAGGQHKHTPAKTLKSPPPSKAPRSAPSRIDSKALARARTAVASAASALREAEHAVRREEFEAARTTRAEKRAGETVDQAREALARAKADLEQAEAGAAAAKRSREAAEKRARDARKELASAQSHADAAAADLKTVERG